MNKFFFLCFLVFVGHNTQAQSHSVLGRWRTVDDETGKPTSVIEIFEKHNKIHGRIVELLNSKAKNPKCDKCDGEDRNKPIIGLVVLKGLKKEKDGGYSDGKILDPKHGKTYKCNLSLETKDKLKVRGFIGINLLGRTQFWERVKS
jgi:uncharacterized protein (DUF2147 family)